MDILVNVVAVSQEVTKMNKANKPYGEIEVTFKTDQGKIANKKLLSFQNANVYSTFKTAKSGDVFTVGTVKNGEYRNWESVTAGGSSPSNAGSGNVTGSVGGSAAGGNNRSSTYETAEERAKRQVLIVKQSSLSNAVATLKTEKNNPTPNEVKKLAQDYVDWVMGLDEKAPDTDNYDDDIPL